MTDQLIVDLDSDGAASVLAWPEGADRPEPGQRFDLNLPLDGDALEELRWYLEDYLFVPSGVYGEHGQRIQEMLPQWGVALFRAVFGDGPARDVYQRLRARGNGPMLVMRSASPELLGLPWELLRDPEVPTPLALDLAGISRSLPAAARVETFSLPGRKLRVLIVIARPKGERDVGYQMIARPLIERLPALRGTVELVVLRPPTFQALQATLTEAVRLREPFHVVHFDGHGGQLGETVLAFERPSGGADYIPASRVAELLNNAQVPVVVLNACQSGAIGKDLEAAIASKLLAGGTSSVVAMSYNVYAVAAAEFMAVFYERLFAGVPVSAAVTAGRKQMFSNDARPSRAGDMPLSDWLIPVHYVSRDIRFPYLSRKEEPDTPAALRGDAADDLHASGAFIGRDWLTCQLETAFHVDRVVLLHGTGGIGKTELAKAFGRWWQSTAGVADPDHVFFHSFEPGVATFGLDGVVNQIGRRLFGRKFGPLERAERHAKVGKELSKRRMLLIWDNFETVHSMPDPDGATKPLDDIQRTELQLFLNQLTASGSRVLITSRSPETWLGHIRRITVAGLTPAESNQYADHLLAPHCSAQRRRRNPAFGELMEWLDGHPLAMRISLPHLETTEPDALLEALRGDALADESDSKDRLTSLSACIAYSYAHLSDRNQRLLPATVLFQGVADASMLAELSQMSGTPPRFRNAGIEEWLAVLAEAAKVGLLTPVAADTGMYWIHPALPGYLAAQWRDEGQTNDPADRRSANQAMVLVCALVCHALADEVNSGESAAALYLIHLHRRTLGSMLGHGLAERMWTAVGEILVALTIYWGTRGANGEEAAWLDKAALAVEDAAETQNPDEDANTLWIAVTGARISGDQRGSQLDNAAQAASRLRARLESLPQTPDQQARLALVYFQLSTIARDQGQLPEADAWCRKALAIAVALDDKQRMMMAEDELGAIAQAQGRYEAADAHLGNALHLAEEIGNPDETAHIYHRLGNLAADRGHLDAAAQRYRSAMTIMTDLGNKPGLLRVVHQLGNVAYLKAQLEAAEDWYREALALEEDLGDQRSMATTYHQLGMVAQGRGQLELSESWYHRALAIKQDLGDVPGSAKTLTQLGALAWEQGKEEAALDWTVRCLALFDAFPHPMTSEAVDNLAIATRHLGVGALAARWKAVTGNELPQVIYDYIERGGMSGG